jgi:hypothetical protein
LLALIEVAGSEHRLKICIDGTHERRVLMEGVDGTRRKSGAGGGFQTVFRRRRNGTGILVAGKFWQLDGGKRAGFHGSGLIRSADIIQHFLAKNRDLAGSINADLDDVSFNPGDPDFDISTDNDGFINST